VLNWFRRKGARPKPGRRAAPADSGGGRRDSHRPTELLDLRRDDARPEPAYVPPEPAPTREPDRAPPRDWAAAGRAAAPSQPAWTPPKGNPTPPGGGNATVMIDTSQASRGGDIAAVMVGINGPLKNRVYPIFDQENHLGRVGKGGCFDKDDETISRDHGKLRLEEGSFHIRPLSDKTPIIVNSERLSEDGEMLRDGDTIQMGQTTFRFKVI
jgi:Inner membrane component of T3SS, cytoplasmic domain